MLKLKHTLFIIVAFFALQTTHAQKGTQSPYSFYGLGELNYEGYATFSSMGGISMGSTDSAVVNTHNPASYSYIGRNMPVFQVGMNGKFSKFSTTEASSNQRHFGLNQFQLGIPIKKNWGAGFGIKPYSFTGYTITRYTVIDSDTTQQDISEGSGGIRIANFGLSYRPVNFSRADTIFIEKKDTSGTKYMLPPIKGTRIQRLSLGVNGNYLFGTSERIRSVEFVPSTLTKFNSRVVDGLRVSGLSWELGLNYQFGFESNTLKRVLSIGATYVPATQVRAFEEVFSYSYIGSYYRGQSVSVMDTVELILDNQGVINKPEAYAVGFEYRFSPRSSGSEIRIGADLKMEKWSTYSTRFSDEENPGNMRDRLSIGFGLEWTPVSRSSLMDKQTNFLSKMDYRFGLFYSQTELLVPDNNGNDVGIDNYGMSFGLGIPILAGNSNTNINFGASLGNLGTTSNGLIQERYAGVYVGLSFTPLAATRWFVKRKYK